MVEVQSIEQFSEDLVANAPQHVTKKSTTEIQELNSLKSVIPLPNDISNPKEKPSPHGDDSQRLTSPLIEELCVTLNFLSKGVLYRNKRVFNKLKAISLKTKRSASTYSNCSHSFVNNSSIIGNISKNIHN